MRTAPYEIIKNEYLRKSQMRNKNGDRLFTDESLIKSFSLAFSISESKIKDILQIN